MFMADTISLYDPVWFSGAMLFQNHNNNLTKSLSVLYTWNGILNAQTGNRRLV